MLKNYFLVAVRHLKRQPAYAALNIFGLTIGIVSCLLIALYLSYELSYDNFQEKGDRVYRISSDIKEPDNAFRWASSQMPLGRTVKEEFAEVEQYVRFVPSGRTRYRRDDISYYIEDTYLADSTLFDVFTFDFVMGDPANALNEPNSVVLAQSEADRIFKGENPMGQLLETDNNSYKVTGVYKDMPRNSHIMIRSVASLSTLQQFYQSQNWGGFNIYTYVLVSEGASIDNIVEKLNTDIIDTHVAVIFDQFDIKIKYEMINIRDIHLYSSFEGEPTPLGNINYIYIFSAVALFLVLIACINYMNLATARSMRRALEVGIRKVMGAHRQSLIGQFITESVLIALIALVLSIVVLLIITPAINNGLGTSLDLGNLLSGQIIATLVGILILTGILSGSYPAFYLSKFSPVAAIRGGESRSGSAMVRRVLVGLQFAISLFMLVGTAVIYDQMQYVQNADMGFDKEGVITFTISRQNRDRWPVLRTKLMQNPNVLNAATATTTPGNGYGKNVMSVETNEGLMESYGIDGFGIDYDYFATLGVEIVEGRDFSYDFVMDTANAVIVNEAMVKRMNWTDPIGKRFQFDGDSTVFHKVVGVAKDFHHQSLYNPIEAIMFSPRFNNNQIMVKVGNNVPDGLSHVKESWAELFPNTPLEYTFLDQTFLEQYENDQLRGQLFLGFSVMMILISALGLLGLASFIAEQRAKEISIRKVLGANVQGLITLIVKDFVWLVLIGAIPAFAAAYYFMDQWLQNFEYHVSINFLLFLGVLIVLMAITILTTGYHAYKAAIVNPSENLKYE